MDWTKIVSALFIGAMMIFIFPRMRQAVKYSPKGSSSQWMGFVLIIAVIALFLMFLISMVR